MQSGELIANRYELQRELGEGGMATVWLALDRTLERPVAIKFLDVSPRARAAMTEQFLREARIAAAVRHRNVIQILDFGTHAEVPFMAMEALAGETMADRFDRASRFELGEVVEIAAHCLEGLAAVHEAGIIHRDLKPENIFLVREPTGTYPKLLDFGISKAVDKRRGRHSAIPTEAGRIVGTPEYMSPEQARGRTDLDVRTDLYSLGVVMYEALTGRLPYDSEHAGEVLLKAVAGGAAEVVQLVPAVGRPISDVVAKAMAVDREQRYASALEMRGALLAAAQPLLSATAGAVALPAVHRDLRRRSSAGAATAEAAHAASPGATQAARGRRPSALEIGAAIAAGTLLIAAAVAFSHLREPASDGSSPRYIVVQGAPAPAAAAAAAAAADEGAAIAAGSHAPSGAGLADAARASAAGAHAIERSAPAASVRRRQRSAGAAPPKVSAGGEQSRSLAVAFDRQKGPVVECLNRHLAHAEDRVQLAVRLTLGESGRVVAVEVLPPEVAARAAGACIAGAVRNMRFGAQPATISIRIPLTARRSAGDARAPL